MGSSLYVDFVYLVLAKEEYGEYRSKVKRKKKKNIMLPKPDGAIAVSSSVSGYAAFRSECHLELSSDTSDPNTTAKWMRDAQDVDKAVDDCTFFQATRKALQNMPFVLIKHFDDKVSQIDVGEVASKGEVIMPCFCLLFFSSVFRN